MLAASTMIQVRYLQFTQGSALDILVKISREQTTLTKSLRYEIKLSVTMVIV
jgi:hypothetical protein